MFNFGGGAGNTAAGDSRCMFFSRRIGISQGRPVPIGAAAG